MTDLLDNLIQLAREAGQEIKKIYDLTGDHGTRFKADRSPVTIADLTSHQIILTGLQRLTPEWPVLSEESNLIPYQERKLWEKHWLVDPLDGTKEFIGQRKEFTVNIALIENGSPLMGVVHAPALELTYFAERGAGAYKKILETNPRQIEVSSYLKSDLKIVTSRLHAGNQLESFLKKIENFESLRIGSSLKLCLVAEGAAHLYPRLWPTMEWDTAAAHCILEEAGGFLTDLSNHSLKYNKPELSNPSFMAAGFPVFPWWNYL